MSLTVDSPGSDVLLLPAALFASMPFPTTLVLAARGMDARIAVSTDRALLDAARRHKRAAFDGQELRCLAIGAENDRASYADLIQWCAWKLHPSWRLDTRTVLGGMTQPPVARAWTIGQVLRAYHATLVEVRM